MRWRAAVDRSAGYPVLSGKERAIDEERNDLAERWTLDRDFGVEP